LGRDGFDRSDRSALRLIEGDRLHPAARLSSRTKVPACQAVKERLAGIEPRSCSSQPNYLSDSSADSAGRQAPRVDETKTIPERIEGIKAALAPRLGRDRLLHAATRALDALEYGFQIIRSYVQLPERRALRSVVKITVSDGVVTSKFHFTERNVVATGGDPIASNFRELG
jgi:hypothetical protein